VADECRKRAGRSGRKQAENGDLGCGEKEKRNRVTSRWKRRVFGTAGIKEGGRKRWIEFVPERGHSSSDTIHIDTTA
jgi:hypothetical protein